MRTLFTIPLLICLFPGYLLSQKQSHHFSIEAQMNYGYLIGHHAEMNRLSTRHFPSFKLYLGHKTTGKRYWHQAYRYPELGVGVFYSPLMFDDELGQAFAIFGYFDQNLGKKDRNNFSFRFGLGPGFLSSKFDPVDNNQNIAIGTNLNTFVFFEIQKAFKLSEALDLKIGIGGVHFSNTGAQMPNLGINLASFQVGLKYRIGAQNLESQTIEEIEIKDWAHETMIGLGRKQSETDKAISTIYNLRYNVIRSFTFKSALIGSADLFFDIADQPKFEAAKVENFFQAGVALGYLLNIEQLQFSLQWGFYLYNKNPDFQAYYHRIGLKWFASEHLYINYSLRSEWARARNVEIGLGWRF